MQQFEDDNNKLDLHDTIGDLGNNLTRGQKKILMYCRSLLTNKHYLIIDKPFKDLNPRTITYITQLLNDLRKNKSIIIIDNSFPLNLNIDYFYTINNKIFEKGT